MRSSRKASYKFYYIGSSFPFLYCFSCVCTGDKEDIDFVDDDNLQVPNDCRVPLERRRRIVQLYETKVQTRKWKFETLKSQYPAIITDVKCVRRWQEQISSQSGGTKFDKYEEIDRETFAQFKAARDPFKTIHDFNIRKWALQAASKFQGPNFQFRASRYWVENFKKRHGITSRKIQKLVSKRDVEDMDKKQQLVDKFREDFKKCAPQFSPSHIFNTDQVGTNYEVSDGRTLSWKGEKKTWGFALSPKNKATHSYTVQPVISMDGRLVGKLFVCLQEAKGEFGKTVRRRLVQTPNLAVTCSTSGKLSTDHVAYFLKTVVKPIVQEDFLLTYDHWTAQMKDDLYEEFGKNDVPACTRLVIPPGCTGMCQPLDTTFNRQQKYVVRRIYNEATIKGIDLTDRNSILKIQSLVHYLLTAEVFAPMIRHSWMSAGLLDSEETFENTQEVCFSFTQATCEDQNCPGKSFIQCSHCSKVLCFPCFFYKFHVTTCEKSPYHEDQDNDERENDESDMET